MLSIIGALASYRSQKIANLLSQIVYDPLDQWITHAITIFTNSEWHSVVPSIFTSNEDCAWIIPPLHALTVDEAAQIGQKLSKKSHTEQLYVRDKANPLKCHTCQQQTCWQFAYKHSACRLVFPSCFRCALREWYQSYTRADFKLTNHNEMNEIYLVKCQHCNHYWSLLSLLHVQGVQSWFYTGRPSVEDPTEL